MKDGTAVSLCQLVLQYWEDSLIPLGSHLKYLCSWLCNSAICWGSVGLFIDAGRHEQCLVVLLSGEFGSLLLNPCQLMQ